MLDFENQFIKPLPSRHNRSDREVGFLPILAAAIPAVAGLAGSLMSKKSSKTGGAPPEAAQAQNVLDLLTKAIGGGEGEQSIKEVVKNIVSTVPPPVLTQVKNAIAELKQKDLAGVQKTVSLVNQIDSKFKPEITALLAGLKAQQVQTLATDEHKRIVAKEAFRKNTTSSLRDIAERLNRIESRLNTSAIVRGEKRIAILGGRPVLER